jgi:membrane protein implicated in regulation of membrane protease activity
LFKNRRGKYERKRLATPQVIWFAIGFVSMVIEFATPGIVILFFGMGAWLVALLCLFIDLSINAQLLVFIASSILFLGFLRKWVKRLFQVRVGPDRAQEELAEFVGGKAIVTKQITSKIKGKVSFTAVIGTPRPPRSFPKASL